MSFASSDLRAALAGYTPKRRPGEGLRGAAVLVPIVVTEGAPPEILYLVRPWTLTAHSGQAAFPGGAIDPGDADPIAAALREAEEELGIPRAQPEVIGLLDEWPTHTGFHITPVVALVPAPLALVPAPGEVESTFTVSLASLGDPENRRTMRGLRNPRGAPPGAEVRLTFWVHGAHTIWGATGLITQNLIDVIRGGR